MFDNGWSATPDYPFVDISIHYHQTVFVADHSAFYIIGGYSSSDFVAVETIGMFKEKWGTWSQVGKLNKARRQHVTLWTGTSFIVAGGLPGTQPTERCERIDNKSDQLYCVDIEPDLAAYNTGAAFLVDDSYCSP